MKFIGTLEWAERNILVDNSQFIAKKFPWLVDIAATIDRRRGAKFIIIMPPQVFKSLFMQLRVCRNIAVEPSPQLWYAKTGAEVEAFFDSKLGRMTGDCQRIREKHYLDPDDRGGKKVSKWPDCTLEMLAADNQNHRNSKSGREIFLDEMWQYEQGAAREIFARSDSYESSRQIIIGTTGPNSPEDETDTMWMSSTRHEWRCVCPTCKQRVAHEFGEANEEHGIRWDSTEETREVGGRWYPSKAAKTCRWVCPACGTAHAYDSATQLWMNDPANGAGYEQTNPDPSPETYGWRAEAVCFRSWPSLVEEFLTGCNAAKLGDLKLLEDFTKKKRVRAWDPGRMIKQDKALPYSEFKLGDDWADEGLDEAGDPIRTMEVDVQQDHFWVTVRRWSNKPKTWGHSRLMAFRKALSAGELEEIRIECGVQPNRVSLDCKFNDQAVYQICHRYGYFAIFGAQPKNNSFLNRDGVRRIYDDPMTVDAYAGKAQAGHCFVTRVQFASHASKLRLQMVRSTKDADGRFIHAIPTDTPDEYIRQAWGEVLIRKRNPRGGFYFEFVKIRDNHAFDCETHGIVKASMLGLLGSEALEAVTEEKEAD